MSDVTLREILEAEKKAQEAVRGANEEADGIRKQAADEAKAIDAESAKRMEAMRSEALEDLERDVEQARRKVIAEADAKIAQWRQAFEAKRDGLIDLACRIIRGEE